VVSSETIDRLTGILGGCNCRLGCSIVCAAERFLRRPGLVRARAAAG
jgi:hypothetical protein